MDRYYDVVYQCAGCEKQITTAFRVGTEAPNTITCPYCGEDAEAI